MRYLASKAIALSVISMFAVFFFLAEAQAQTILGYWQFGEGSGDEKQVKDSSEMGNHGEIGGDCEWVEGKFGGGLQIDGRKGWVAVPNDTISESLKAANALTMATWLKPIEFSDDAIQLHSEGGNYFLRVQKGFGVDPGINIGGWKGAGGNTPLEVGEWYHVAATYDGETLKSYLNGKLESETALAGTLPVGGTLFLGTIGWHPEGGAGYGSGVLDEALMADYAFTEEELAEAMEAGKAVGPAGKLGSTWGKVKAGY